MKIYKSDPDERYYGVRFELRSGRVAERFFESSVERADFLDLHAYDALSFSEPA